MANIFNKINKVFENKNRSERQHRGPVDHTKVLDIVLMFDTTGSMYEYLNNVRQNLRKIVLEISSELSNVHYGVIAYGDHCDEGVTYVTKTCQLTSNPKIIEEFIMDVEKTGGGDAPEALEDALHEANALKWRGLSNKAIVLVGDAPPHGVMDSFKECPRGFDYRDETRNLSKKRVKIYSVLCGNLHEAEKTFRWFAKQTNGKFLRLENIDDLVDLIIGVCMKEADLLSSFENKLIERGGMTESKRKLMRELKDDKKRINISSLRRFHSTPKSSKYRINIESQITTCTTNINCPIDRKPIYSGESAFKCRVCGALYHPSCVKHHLKTSNNCLLCRKTLT